MKKTIILVFVFFLFSAVSVLAINQVNSRRPRQSDPTKVQINRNSIQTTNNEEDQLEIDSQQQSGSSSADRKRLDVGNRLNKVSDQVHQLLQSRINNTGIGKQVREIAQNQEKAQEKIKSSYNKLNSRKRFFSFLFGSDHKSLESLTSQLNENQERIDRLTELRDQIANQADSQQIQETIDSMTDQNTSLKDLVGSENKRKSIFGWVLKLFR